MNALTTVATAVSKLNDVVVITRKVSANQVRPELLKDLKRIDLAKVDLSKDDAFCEQLGEEVFVGLMQQPKKQRYIGKAGRGRLTLADIGRQLLTY